MTEPEVAALGRQIELRLDDAAGLEPRSVAIVFGTRPEIIKLAGIIDLLGSGARTIFSGQHFDESLSQVFFDDLRLRQPDVTLAVGGRTRARQIGDLLLRLEEQFTKHRPAMVVVQGDTNTAVGGALAANALELPLVHVEAGLRSFDRRMPEEHNRVIADHLADLCLAPTVQARDNLLAERIHEERIVITGNTVVDSALRLLPAAAERQPILKDYGVEPDAFVLATFHRPENVDDPERLAMLLECLAALNLPVLFPMHPRTRKQMRKGRLESSGRQLRIVDPIGYKAFLALAAECAFLLSDSGGVQEEASVVKRPAIIVRRSTERPEVLGTFATRVESLAGVTHVADELLRTLDDTHRRLADTPTPYGDGTASARCVYHMMQIVRVSSSGRAKAL